MTYNILIVKNRYKKKVDLSKCYKWFKDNVKLNIQVDEITTDFDLSTIYAHNATFNGVLAGGINEKLRPLVPENKYHAVIFIYGNSLDGIRLNATNWEGSLYKNTEMIQVSDPSWKIVNHEMFHGFFGKLIRNGVGVVDNMDTYYRDNILDVNNGDTNRVIALKTISPYWDKILSFTSTTNKPTVTITRQSQTNKETLGELVANHGSSTFTCKTLELPWLDNKSNISCIPKGTYEVKYTFSPRKLVYTYEIQSVPNRSGIRIHVANYYTDLLGCIALGGAVADINKDGQLDVTNSKVAITSFEGFMGKKPFTLVIR